MTPKIKELIKKFLQICLVFFIAFPIAFCIIIYAIGCWISWDILTVNIDWVIVRIYLIVSCVVSIFLTFDK
jgi:hypothetical protein